VRGGTGLTIAGALLFHLLRPEARTMFHADAVRFYKTIAPTSIAPSTTQQIALRRSPASQYPVAALKQRIALVHPLPHAAGLLSIFRNFIGISYPSQLQPWYCLCIFLDGRYPKRRQKHSCP
jgi:hypothetical protein